MGCLSYLSAGLSLSPVFIELLRDLLWLFCRGPEGYNLTDDNLPRAHLQTSLSGRSSAKSCKNTVTDVFTNVNR